MNESIIALVFTQIIDVISYLHSKILNTNDDILIYCKYGIIINKNIINYNAKLIFKILYCNIKNYHQYQLLHMVLIVILYLIIIIMQIHHY